MHVKLIVKCERLLENIMQKRTSAFNKKVVAPFDRKVPAYCKKRTNNPREQSITEDPFEEPTTEDSKRTLLLRTIKVTYN